MYNRDSKIMRKLLGKSAPDTSSGEHSSLVGNHSSSSIPATFRPSKSQDSVYVAGVPISCLDVSPDRRAVALGGPHILKTIVHEDHPTNFGFRFGDGVDLRAAITAQPATGVKANATPDQLNIRDVRWHGGSTIFTACANGRIFAYDLARIGAGGSSEPLEYIHMQEDSRQVNTLDVNPHLNSWLLSGSQDGLARVFDTANAIHTRSGVLTFRQRFAALRCIDSIRQVKWSPRVGHEMACCTDSGVVIKWDVRSPSRPLLRINAHEKACTGISWHPDGIHLITSGSDCKLHVWDMGSTADRRQKPKWTISTPAPVSAVAWRPGLWSATARSRRAAQVAVAYDENSTRRYGTSVVHIWDLARPTLPYKEIERFDSSPAALSWQDQDMLWTVGQDGLFNQCDVAHAPRTLDRRPTSAMAFSSKGDVLMFLDERAQQHRPRRSSVLNASDVIPRSSFDSSPRMPMLSVSRSDSEEDVLGSFISPRRGVRKRRSIARTTNSLSTTPPSSMEDTKLVLGLEQAIKTTGTFKSQQAMASGHLPAAKTSSSYQYLASIYLETLEKELPYKEDGKPMVDRVANIMERYAEAAEAASLFRLAQTWRVLAFAVSLLLKRRAQYHLELRLSQFQKLKLEVPRASKGRRSGDATPRRPSAVTNGGADSRLLGRSLLSDEIQESTSNVPTPIARPVDHQGADSNGQNFQYGKRLTPIVEPDSFTIGPAAHEEYMRRSSTPRRRLDSVPISLTSEESEVSHTEGYDFYDTDALSQAIDVPSPKTSQDWIARKTKEQSRPTAKISRQNSDESYGQLFSISETGQLSRRSSGPAGGLAKSNLSHSESIKTKTSDGSSVEYGSRIRGDHLRRDSPEKGQPRKQSKADSPEEVFMISQTTLATDDDTYPSQTSFPSQDSENYSQSVDGDIKFPSPRPEARNPALSRRPSWDYQYDPRSQILESDYIPWEDDPPYPHPLLASTSKPSSSVPALDPYALITRALNFESKSTALNASAIILLLKPLVPDSIIETPHARAILRQHHSRLMGMGLFVEAALLRNLCIQGWPEGLPYWGESYTAIFAPGQDSVKVSLACSSCGRPREIDPLDSSASVWTCERCKSVMAPCAVCGHREPELAAHDPIEEAAAHPEMLSLSEWFYCPGCAHGGHASCIQTWHSVMPSDPTAKYSGGCCPMDGCGHACLPGKYRGEMATARADELARMTVERSRSRTSSPQSRGAGVVRSDRDDVPQSKAVGMAREALSKGSAGSGGGILSSSPGRMIGERERRKSVKFAGTDR
ncbi:unnamed protein product [Clonostachys byssicola]|uniref:WD repeat-containing protein n=1 Tax=Clonostachys byssicola TaxID=160290 RepID=A0A9N9U9V1_9HYPO|nr:unnamed protein product [Clonostachys byssicola]